MPLKGAKKRSYNKKYCFKNKDLISTLKKEAYYEDFDKSHEEYAAHSKTNDDEHTDSGTKPTTRSKANRDLDGNKLTARSKPNYDRNPESGTKLTARFKANYDRDPESGTKQIQG